MNPSGQPCLFCNYWTSRSWLVSSTERAQEHDRKIKWGKRVPLSEINIGCLFVTSYHLQKILIKYWRLPEVNISFIWKEKYFLWDAAELYFWLHLNVSVIHILHETYPMIFCLVVDLFSESSVWLYGIFLIWQQLRMVFLPKALYVHRPEWFPCQQALMYEC